MTNPIFKMKARAISQLGEQLIKSESIALIELIKNAYDADASTCRITLKNPELPERGEIEILDDGEGMSFETLRGAFLEIGTDYKKQLREKPLLNRTLKFSRLRLGDKGIGRLGIHRLGKHIQIVTKKENAKKESVLEIDWDTIDRSEYLEDIPVYVSERKPELFRNGNGTRILITNLRNQWNRRTVRDCKRMITSLNSPFESDDSFKADFYIPNYEEWVTGLLDFEEIEQYKLFSFDITMEGSEITKFFYKFCPWKTMKEVNGRTLHLKDIEDLTLLIKEGGNPAKDDDKIDLSKHRIGKIRFCGNIFDRDSAILNLDVSDKMGLKEYLNENGGIRVYRDGVRVLDYGEPGNDWLNLGAKRVNAPGKRISNNLILASVSLESENSSDLKEKANREGFLENDAYNDFVNAILFALGRVEFYRRKDKEILREAYSPKSVSEPVINSISKLKTVVEKHVKEEGVKKNINKYISRIQYDYERITDNLIRSAGAGLNLIVVIHQIEKIVKQIMAHLKRKNTDDVVIKQVADLASIVEGYSILVKSSEKKPRNISEQLQQGITNVRFRLIAHKIELISGSNCAANLFAICSSNHVQNALLNLFDNAIWWLSYQKDKERQKKLFVDVSDQLEGYVSIVVADNGTGFKLSAMEAKKPFVTLKPGGMGIGLHLTETIMESLDGLLLIGQETDDFDIPKEFNNGAKVALAFKKH